MSAPYLYRDASTCARDIVRGVDGLYVGQLDRDEMDAFEEGIREGFARRCYSTGAGFLGCAKVRYIERNTRLT